MLQKPALLNTRKILAAALVLGATALALPGASTSAAAMPLGGLQPAILRDGQAPQIDQVRWVCGPWRCHWAPNYYRPMGWGYGPRPYAHPHWRRW
jgi:hypothetical protein